MVDFNYLSESLKRALSYLLIEHPKSYQIVISHLFELESVEDIGLRLGLHPHTVGYHLLKGRKFLLDRLDNDDEAKAIIFEQNLNRKFPRIS